MDNQLPEQENAIVEETVSAENPVINESTEKKAAKNKFTKLFIIGGIVLALIVIAIVIVILTPSKFEKVKDECVMIAGTVSGSGDYFTIDTCPDAYDNMDPALKAMLLPDAQKNALEAIKYANEAFGFNESVYSQVMRTSALMGRQSEENDKYKVSWTYHPDDGLEVTYEEK